MVLTHQDHTLTLANYHRECLIGINLRLEQMSFSPTLISHRLSQLAGAEVRLAVSDLIFVSLRFTVYWLESRGFL